MRNAAVGVQRLIARLRPGPGRRSAAAVTIQRRSIAIARAVARRIDLASGVPACRVSASSSITAVGLVAVALVLSNLGTSRRRLPGGATGNIDGAGTEPRIALGGDVSGIVRTPRSGGIDDRPIAGGGIDAGLGSTLD